MVSLRSNVVKGHFKGKPSSDCTLSLLKNLLVNSSKLRCYLSLSPRDNPQYPKMDLLVKMIEESVPKIIKNISVDNTHYL